MVNFENGTLVKGAYVEINGVEYPVHMPEYSGTTPLNAENLNKIQNDLLTKIEDLENQIDLSSDDGYIRFPDGFQIAWKRITATAGGTQWGNIYYSDHEFGKWKVPFTNIFGAWSNINSMQYWSGCSGYTNDTAGTVRAFRPNSSTLSTSILIIGFGSWK